MIDEIKKTLLLLEGTGQVKGKEKAKKNSKKGHPFKQRLVGEDDSNPKNKKHMSDVDRAEIEARANDADQSPENLERIRRKNKKHMSGSINYNKNKTKQFKDFVSEGYESKVLDILDKHNIDAHFDNNVLVLYDAGDANRVEDVMMDYPGITMPDMRVEDESNMEPDDSMDGDFDSGMASAGFGTDEDYGDYGGYEESLEAGRKKPSADFIQKQPEIIKILRASPLRPYNIQFGGDNDYIITADIDRGNKNYSSTQNLTNFENELERLERLISKHMQHPMIANGSSIAGLQIMSNDDNEEFESIREEDLGNKKSDNNKSNAYIQGYKDGFKRKPQDYGMKNREYQTGYDDGKREHDNHGVNENDDDSENEKIAIELNDLLEKGKDYIKAVRFLAKKYNRRPYDIVDAFENWGNFEHDDYFDESTDDKTPATFNADGSYNTNDDEALSFQDYEADEEEKVEEDPEMLKDHEFNDMKMWERAVKARGLRINSDTGHEGPHESDPWNYAHAEDDQGNMYGHWGPDEEKSDTTTNDVNGIVYSGVLFQNSDDYLNYINNSDSFDKDDGQLGSFDMESKHRDDVERVIEGIENAGAQVYKVKTVENKTTLSIRKPDGTTMVQEVITDEDIVRSMHRQWGDYIKEIEGHKSSYATLADAGPEYAPGSSQLWYWTKEYSRDFMMGPGWLQENRPELLPTPRTLSVTHALIGTLKESNPERIFEMMQGENWSPNGEARAMIERSGTGHTSMSVGDVIKHGNGLYMVDSYGFKRLGDTMDESKKPSVYSRSASVGEHVTEKMSEGNFIFTPKNNDPTKGYHDRGLNDIDPNNEPIDWDEYWKDARRSTDKDRLSYLTKLRDRYAKRYGETAKSVTKFDGLIQQVHDYWDKEGERITKESKKTKSGARRTSMFAPSRKVGEATFGTKYKHTPAELAQIKGWENAMDLKFKNPYDHSQPELRDAYIKGYMAARRKQKRIGFGRIADLPNRKLTREGNLNTQEAKKPAAKNSNTESLKLVIDGSDVGFEGEDYYYDGDNIIANDRRIAGKILRAINTSGLFSKQAVVVKNGEQPVIGFDALADARSVFQDTIGTDEFPMDVEIKTDSTNKFYIYTNGKRNVRTFDKFPHAKRYIKKLDQQLQDQSGPERMEV